MKTYFFIIFMSMAFLGNAQKNEFYFGHNTASFFDSTGFSKNYSNKSRSYKFYRKIQLIGYRRAFGNKWQIGVEYGNFNRAYRRPENWMTLDSILIARLFSFARITIQKSFCFSEFSIAPQVAISRRYDGFKAVLVDAILPSPTTFGELFFDDYVYRQYGFSAGVEFKHPIFRNLHGQLNTSYTRFAASDDQNMLMISYAIGYSFGLKKSRLKLKKASFQPFNRNHGGQLPIAFQH